MCSLMCLAPVDVGSTQVPMSIPVACMELTSVSHTNVCVCTPTFICTVSVNIYKFTHTCVHTLYTSPSGLPHVLAHIVGWRSACLLNHTNAQIPEHSRRGSRVHGAVLVHMGRNLTQPGCCRLPLSPMSACAGLLASQHWRGTCAGFTSSCGLVHVP